MTHEESEMSDGPLETYAADFGNLVFEAPQAVFQPRSIGEVVEIVKRAATQHRPVVVRGQGHTVGGQSQRRDGWVIDTRRLSGVDIPKAGVVRCGAGVLWRDLVRMLFAQGQTLPVLTDYLGLSVGGTLSVGGVGGQSFREGFQIDQVLELVVVDGLGRVHRIGSEDKSGLFDAARGGLGRLGVIVDATLRTVRAPIWAQSWALPYSTLESFLHDQVLLATAARFDYLVGNFVGQTADAWGYSLEAVVFREDAERAQLLSGLTCNEPAVSVRTTPYLDYLLRLDTPVKQMQASGHCHPWTDVFIPQSSASAFIEEVLREIAPRDVGAGYVMTYPLRASCSSAPLLQTGQEAHAFLFDVLASVPRSSAQNWAQHVQRWTERALAAGGGFYPIGSARLSSSHWQRQLGSWHSRLIELKAEFDPAGIFPYSL